MSVNSSSYTTFVFVLFGLFLSHNSHLAIDGHRSVEDAMHAQDGRLRGVDDGCAKQGAKHTTVADGEGASIHIFNSKLIVTSLGHTTQDFLIFVIKVNGYWY